MQLLDAYLELGRQIGFAGLFVAPRVFQCFARNNNSVNDNAS